MIIAATLTALLVEFRNDIASIILNRPDKKGAVSFAMMQERIQVAKQIQKINRLNQLSCVLVANGRRFCTDIDLKNLTYSKQKVKL